MFTYKLTGKSSIGLNIAFGKMKVDTLSIVKHASSLPFFFSQTEHGAILTLAERTSKTICRRVNSPYKVNESDEPVCDAPDDQSYQHT